MFRLGSELTPFIMSFDAISPGGRTFRLVGLMKKEKGKDLLYNGVS